MKYCLKIGESITKGIRNIYKVSNGMFCYSGNFYYGKDTKFIKKIY